MSRGGFKNEPAIYNDINIKNNIKNNIEEIKIKNNYKEEIKEFEKKEKLIKEEIKKDLLNISSQEILNFVKNKDYNKKAFSLLVQ
jgi:hypothetical protein